LVSFGEFRGVVLTIIWVLSLYAYAFLIFRLFLWICPLHPGEIPQASPQEFVYHVYLLFFLMLFYPIMRSGLIPVPLMRLVYLALGAKLGTNTYSSGIILDPPFVSLGDNTLVGQYALLVPHVIEGSKLAHYPICVGSNATIGAGAIVLSGVTIGDGAIVSTGAVVTKGTAIGPDEVWGGVPARRLSTKLRG
jgi:acetyltransferase-like isoleucine patch superfamily enzyme